MHVDPLALITAAIELEAEAARLRGVMAATRSARHVLAPGSDEVSVSAAHYFNTTSESLAASADRAVTELEDAGAALRRYAAAYELEDHQTQSDLASAPI